MIKNEKIHIIVYILILISLFITFILVNQNFINQSGDIKFNRIFLSLFIFINPTITYYLGFIFKNKRFVVMSIFNFILILFLLI